MELIVGTKSDNFYVTLEYGAEAEARKLGVNLKVTGPATFSPTQQKPLIDAIEVSKPDALIVVPTDSAASASPSPGGPGDLAGPAWAAYLSVIGSRRAHTDLHGSHLTQVGHSAQPSSRIRSSSSRWPRHCRLSASPAGTA